MQNVGIAGLALVLVLTSNAEGCPSSRGCANLTEGRCGELNAAIMRARTVHPKRRRRRLRYGATDPRIGPRDERSLPSQSV
jgi:hypothetical protein